MKRVVQFIVLTIVTLLLSSCVDSIQADLAPDIISLERYSIEVYDSDFELSSLLSIKDDVDGSIDPMEDMIDYQEFDVNQLGEYEVLVSVEDSFKNTSSKSITLEVVDRTAPSIELLGSTGLFIEVGGDYQELGVKIEDNYDEDLNVIIISDLDLDTVGQYSIEYYTVDSSMNQSISVYRRVEVIPSEIIAPIDEDGYYVSKEDVALYLFTYGTLPDNFMTKSEASSHISNYWTEENRASIGGDSFGNRENLLPIKTGRLYYEVDINYYGGNRGSERIVYSSDGFIFYTADHYDSFVLYDPSSSSFIDYSKDDQKFD